MEYMESFMQGQARGYSKDMVHNCGFRALLYPHHEMKAFYKDANYQARDEIFRKIDQFINSMYSLISLNF